MPTERGGIPEYGVIADMAVVRDVCVRHEHVVVSYGRDPSTALGPAVNGHELAKHISIADEELGRLAVKLQILRNQPDRHERKDLVSVANLGRPIDHRGGADAAIASETDMLPDHGMRTDYGALPYHRVGVHDGARIDGDPRTRPGARRHDHRKDEIRFGGDVVADECRCVRAGNPRAP